MPNTSGRFPVYYPAASAPLVPWQDHFEDLAQSVSDSLVAAKVPIAATNQADRDAKFPSPVNGDRVWRMDWPGEEYYDGTAWKPWNTGWITYAPTTTIVIGTGGSASAVSYKYEAGRIRVKGMYRFGSSGGGITGGATITLPVSRVALIHAYEASSELGSYFDASTGFAYRFNVHAFGSSTTTVAFLMGLQPVSTIVAAGNPVALGDQDAISFDFAYDPA